MFLKRLDMIGFKSFAERTSIEFTNGVTAIVGPNGSGKSNIIDAIRWVLGEQSAKSLRGSKMEDIIFNGSDARKKLNFTEVSLTFDNSSQLLPLEFNEITVTRRLYRSGESEFFINKQPCRLKDITELFIDSGIGKEAYSTIGQGKIDEILNSKPEDRRSIFEEAAGVLKYKIRRDKAEHKLKETDDNLNRVQDIVFELQKQIEPLEIQSSIAKEYLHTKEELANLEISLLVTEIESMHQMFQQETKELEKTEDLFIQKGTEFTQLEQQLEKEKETINQLDLTLEKQQERLIEITKELEKFEGQKKVLEERTNHAQSSRKEYETALVELKEKQKKQLVLKKEKEAKYHQLKEEVTSVAASITEKEQQLFAFEESMDEKIERLKNEYFDVLNQETALNNEKRYILEERNKRYIKYERVDKERIEMQKKKEASKKQMEQLLASIEIKKAQIKHLQSTIQTKKEMQVAFEAEMEERSHQWNKAKQFIEQFEAKKDVLESMKEEYAGFNQGVKAVLKNRESLKINGAVAELIHVPKRFETAIDIALGGSMQHIVTKSSKDAQNAIRYLKQHQSGRATFLPLDAIKKRYVNKEDLIKISNIAGFIGVASECVTCDEAFLLVKEHLLGSILIAENLESATKIAKVLRYRYRLVTLEGDVVSQGGAMTGGSVKKRTYSLLSRTREIDELTEKIAEMHTQLEQLEVLASTLQEKKKAIDDSLSQARLRLETEKEELTQLEDTYRKHDSEYQLVEKQLYLYERENEDLLDQKQMTAKRIDEIESTLSQIETEKEQLVRQLEKYETRKKQSQLEKERLKETLTEEKINHSKKEERLGFTKEELEQIKRLLKQTEEQIERLSEKLQLLFLSEDETDENKETIHKQITMLAENKKSTIEWIKEKRKERFKLYQRAQDIELMLKELKREQKQYQEILVEKQVNTERLDVQLGHYLNRLNETYHLTFERAKQTAVISMEKEEIKKRVTLLQKTMEELGVVNIGAIEEFERVSERYQFLTVQKNDLEEAKDTLLEVIEEMDEEVKKRFEETFYGIQRAFRRVFKELFQGGEADLLLTDESDLLLTGIEIVAKPPGKKLQNLALLSGGERSLTALCLLFAMIEYRAFPFVILDEVEAALDEANVVRFSQFLKRFSHSTQFIVITHRKGTMEQADILYGITMQELGVSTMVSVKLEESLQYVQTNN